MSESVIYKAGIAGHYHVKSHGGAASREQLTFEIDRLTAELASVQAELEEANYRLDRFQESEHALAQETIEALKRAEAAERERDELREKCKAFEEMYSELFVHHHEEKHGNDMDADEWDRHIADLNSENQALREEVKTISHNYDVLKMVYDNLEKTHYETTYNRVQRLEAENERYRKALERIAAIPSCLPFLEPASVSIAKEALEGK